MNIKEFFRPTWSKLILFVILNALIHLLKVCCMGIQKYDDPSRSFIFEPFNFLRMDLVVSGGPLSWQSGGLFFVLGIALSLLIYVLNLAWQYLLACLVIFAFNKLRKK